MTLTPVTLQAPGFVPGLAIVAAPVPPHKLSVVPELDPHVSV